MASERATGTARLARLAARARRLGSGQEAHREARRQARCCSRGCPWRRPRTTCRRRARWRARARRRRRPSRPILGASFRGSRRQSLHQRRDHGSKRQFAMPGRPPAASDQQVHGGDNEWHNERPRGDPCNPTNPRRTARAHVPVVVHTPMLAGLDCDSQRRRRAAVRARSRDGSSGLTAWQRPPSSPTMASVCSVVPAT